MKGLAIALALVLSGSAGSGQAEESGWPPVWPEPPVKLLIVGTFHFSDPGLDSYRPKHDVDVLSPKRQSELAGLLERLASFRPNKIAVEWPYSKQASLDQRYTAYRTGSLELSPDEIDQIAFRLAARLGHARLYAVDAKRRFYEPWIDPDEYAIAHGQEDWLAPGVWDLYERQHTFEDALKTRQTLIEHLLYLNTEERALRSHGQYLIGNFAVGSGEDYPGVDSKTAWYNRNLKIFANIQRTADLEGDRILLLIGSGHLAILRHAAQASPQFELVDVAEVLGSG